MRLVQFFEGDDHQLSMTRLLAFLSFFPSSYVLIASLTDTALGLYLGAYVFQLVGGKTADAYMKKVTGNALVPKSVHKS